MNTDQEIHEKLLLAKRLADLSESVLLGSLIIALRSKTFLHNVKYPTLFAYCVDELKMTESKANNFSCVARKSLIFPELREAVEKDKVPVSKLRRICPNIKKENKQELITFAKENSTQKIIEKMAELNPQAKTKDYKKPLGNGNNYISCTLSEEVYNDLTRVMDIIGTRSFEQAIAKLSKDFLERKDPVLVAKRIHKKKEAKALTLALKQAAIEEGSKEANEILDQIKVDSPAQSNILDQAKPNNSTQALILDQTKTNYPAQTQTDVRNMFYDIDLDSLEVSPYVEGLDTTKLIRLVEQEDYTGLEFKENTFYILETYKDGLRKHIVSEDDFDLITQPRTRQIKKSLLHRIHLRDGGKCRFIKPNGERCNSSHNIEIHHNLPFSMGGPNHELNLTTLCHEHHRWVHEVYFGQNFSDYSESKDEVTQNTYTTLGEANVDEPAQNIILDQAKNL